MSATTVNSDPRYELPASATQNRPHKPVISFSMRLAFVLRMAASLESSYVVPRFQMCSSDSTFPNPGIPLRRISFFTIQNNSRSEYCCTTRDVRSDARGYIQRPVSLSVLAVGPMTHRTIGAVKSVSLFDAGLQIVRSRWNIAPAVPINQKAFNLSREKRFEFTRFLERAELDLSECQDDHGDTQRANNKYHHGPALHLISRVLKSYVECEKGPVRPD
jgi:hypothetical protein